MNKSTIYKPARGELDANIPDELVETACAAYWWYLSPGVLTWESLVSRGDDRIPEWREKMRAALTAANMKAK